MAHHGKTGGGGGSSLDGGNADHNNLYSGHQAGLQDVAAWDHCGDARERHTMQVRDVVDHAAVLREVVKEKIAYFTALVETLQQLYLLRDEIGDDAELGRVIAHVANAVGLDVLPYKLKRSEPEINFVTVQTNFGIRMDKRG